MKRAFTITEIIFVLVITAIIAATAFYGYKTDRLRRDADFVFMQLQQARYQGLNGLGIGGLGDKNRSCVDPDRIKEIAKKEGYDFRSEVLGKEICFDNYARPYADMVELQTPQNLRISYKSREKVIKILPKSGYVIISQ